MLPLQGVWDPSLVGELGSHLLRKEAKKKKKNLKTNQKRMDRLIGVNHKLSTGAEIFRKACRSNGL